MHAYIFCSSLTSTPHYPQEMITVSHINLGARSPVLGDKNKDLGRPITELHIALIFCSTITF